MSGRAVAGDDLILTAYAMIRAYIDGDRATVATLIDGADNLEGLTMCLLNLASSHTRELAEQLDQTPGELLDDLIKARLDLGGMPG